MTVLRCQYGPSRRLHSNCLRLDRGGPESRTKATNTVTSAAHRGTINYLTSTACSQSSAFAKGRVSLSAKSWEWVRLVEADDGTRTSASERGLRKSGIEPPFRLYDLRHTYGTRAIEAGIEYSVWRSGWGTRTWTRRSGTSTCPKGIWRKSKRKSSASGRELTRRYVTAGKEI